MCKFPKHSTAVEIKEPMKQLMSYLLFPLSRGY